MLRTGRTVRLPHLHLGAAVTGLTAGTLALAIIRPLPVPAHS